MSVSNDDDLQLDEEIRQSAKNLDGMRKRRRLMELQTQIAEEEHWLQEAQQRLDHALSSVDPNSSGSANLPSPDASITTAQDTNSAVDALVESVLNPIDKNTTPVNSNTLLNNQTSANNNIPAKGQAPVYHEGAQPEADLPAVHQPYIPELMTATRPSDQARVDNGEAKLESPALVMWANDTAKESTLSLYPPYEEEENNEEKSTVFSENRHEPEKSAVAVSSQPQTFIPAAPLWTSTQPTHARRILATPSSLPDLDLHFGSYKGKAWTECVRYINTLEAHFARYPSYYTEARKVELGAKYIGRKLMTEWHHHIMTSGNTSWFSYCTFLVQQLSRWASHSQATYEIANASQRIGQPVTHFALWLIQWAPQAPEVSSNEFMVYLLRGILPDIRARAQKSYTQFSDYTSFTAYLQEVENSIPARAKLITRQKNSTISNIELFVPMDIDESDLKLEEGSPSQLPTHPAQRFEVLPPTDPHNQSKRRQSPEVLTPRDLPLYSARSWRQCKTFMMQLQDYFDKHGNCKESRKIEIGRRNLSGPLLSKWDGHAACLKQVTWFAFCVFLVDQIPSEAPGNFNYSNIRQWPSQSVHTFALELLRWAPDNMGAAHNRLRHLWDRVLPGIRSRARKSWADFDEFHVFVAYLQQVEDSFSIRQQAANRSNLRPRKPYHVSGSS